MIHVNGTVTIYMQPSDSLLTYVKDVQEDVCHWQIHQNKKSFQLIESANIWQTFFLYCPTRIKVSCSPRSGSQVDDLPGVTGSKGICSSGGSSGLDSCSAKGLISTSAIFYSFLYIICLFKMTDYKLYRSLPQWGPETLGPEGPSAPPEAPGPYLVENPQVAYHLSVIQAKQRGLKNKEQMFKQKYEKYTKILNRLTWSNACSSGISITTGISSVATFAAFVGLPVSAALGAASMIGAIASGIISVLAKKYQKKLKKVTKLIDIVTPALVVFERVISGALKVGIIDEGRV